MDDTTISQKLTDLGVDKSEHDKWKKNPSIMCLIWNYTQQILANIQNTKQNGSNVAKVTSTITEDVKTKLQHTPSSDGGNDDDINIGGGLFGNNSDDDINMGGGLFGDDSDDD